MSSEVPRLPETVALVLEHCLAAAPTLGTGRLVCVDGPAGAGKTTLGEALLEGARRRVPTASLIHLDDLYEGWHGLGQVASRVRDQIVVPLLAGEPGRYRRWDWLADAWAEEHVVDPVALLVLEGVGSAAVEYDAAITTRVWVGAPRDLRLARGVERDGPALRARWEEWQTAEEPVLAAQRTRERADVIVDGTGADPAVLASAGWPDG
jgi:uridine kinase